MAANYYSGTIQKGSGSTEDIKNWQKYLNTQGYNLGVDGVFGDKTDAATRAYQQANGLTADGIVGEKTWGQAGFANLHTPVKYETPTEPNSYSDIDLSKYDSGYQKSDDVIKAETNKTNAENAVNNYGDFSYSNQASFDEIMNKILNREEFSYDLNGDALYQQYKDKYIQQGKMAMQDTMGQAAAMTGGYGNSYAASVGNQAYQASLENLNNIVPELYQMAYDKYKQEGQDLYNQYGMLSDDRNTQYGMWADKYNQLVADRDYYGNEANNAYVKDYGEWSDQRDFDTNQYWTETEFGYGQYRDAVADAQWETQFNEAQRQYVEQMELAKASASSGGVNLNNIPGINTTDPTWFDENGNFKKAEYLGTTDDGKASFRIEGKTVTYPVGTNPYTQTVNPDIEHGACNNGYQPNNVGGKPLTKTGTKDYMNGVLQNVWQTADGTRYIWDGTKNKYFLYTE